MTKGKKQGRHVQIHIKIITQVATKVTYRKLNNVIRYKHITIGYLCRDFQMGVC